MPRDSNGNYSLPAGNPVTTGTTISSSTHNTTLSDIASEITNSVAVDGSSAMDAPLMLDDGTAADPALTFESDPDCGLYRIGANNPAIAAGGNLVQSWNATGSTVALTLTVTGAATLSSTLAVTGASTLTGAATLSSTLAVTGAITAAAGGTVTQSTADTAGWTSTGNGTGRGGVFTGGATGIGVSGTGGGTAAGGTFANGTASDATNARVALAVTNGNIDLNGVTAQNSNIGLQNKLSPMNLVKAWALITTNGLGAATVTAGFNVDSASISSGKLRVAFAHGFSTANYCAVATMGSSTPGDIAQSNPTAAYIEIHGINTSGAAIDFSTEIRVVHVVCLGAH